MAGLIPQSFIDDLLARTDIVDLIDKRVPLKRAGANHKACCPFHKEKSPSFTVNATKQFYYCFGCGAAGNALGFLMAYDNLSFPESAEYLARIAGVEIPRTDSDDRRAQQQQQQPLFDTLTQAQQFFIAQLRQHPRARSAIDYLKHRGLSGTIARDFGIGFAPPGWRNLLDQLGNSDAALKHISDAGLSVENAAQKVYDRFRYRIMFPIRDVRGRIVGFGGRIIDPKDQPKYLNSPETPVFNKSRELYGLYEAKRSNRQLPQLLVVEGYMDVIALAQCGVSYAVATMGTAVGSAHLQSLFKYTSRVCFCFDGDNAGRKAAAKALAVGLPLINEDKELRFLFLAEGHDPDTLVREIGAAAFEKLVNNAQPLSEYLFDYAANGAKLDTVDSRARFAKTAKGLINTMADGDFKRLMLAELKRRCGLDTDAIDAEPTPIDHDDIGWSDADIPAEFDHDNSAPTPPVQTKPSANKSAATSLSLAHKACVLLIHNPQLIRIDTLNSDTGELGLGLENDTEAEQVLAQLLATLASEPMLSTASLIGRWYNSEHRNFVEQLLRYEKLCPHDGIEAEFIDTLERLKGQSLRRERKRQIEALNAIGFASLSDEQKQKLRQLLAQNAH